MATSLGFQTAPGRYRVGHMLGLRHPAGLPTGLASELTKVNIFVSMRGASIRISPHLYNTKDDVDQLFRMLTRLI